ncbi:MAG: sensor domain-containing diguanylate cyclase [Gammaproteobacteria bacterium]
MAFMKYAGLWDRNPTNKDFFDVLEHIASNLPGFIYQLHLDNDNHYRYTYASKSVESMFGVTPAEVEANADVLLSMVHPDDYERIISESIQCAETLSHWHSYFRMVRPDGVTLWIEARDTPQRLEDGSMLWTGYANDVTRQREAEAHIMHLAHHDVLTGLLNRSLFSELLKNNLKLAARNNKRTALLFIDLDEFKPVNDTHGHAIGDMLLQQVAERIKTALRSSDAVCRIGGDEFVVMLPVMTSEADVLLVAGKILTQMCRPFELEDYSIEISASIGIAVYPEHGTDDIELMKNADRAMYMAKKKGRNQVQILPSAGSN